MDQSPFRERNQTTKSRRRLKKLAVDNGLGGDFVEALACRFWNWDRENFCWVPKHQLNDMPDAAFSILETALDWPRDRVVPRAELIDRATAYASEGIAPHAGSFVASVPARNCWSMSPLITAATLTNLTAARHSSCTIPDGITFDDACSYAATKLGLFARRHNDLGYAAFDSITLAMGEAPAPSDGTWLSDTCDAIAELPSGSKLVELVRATSKALGGNKATRSRTLMALGIVGVLGTDEFTAGTDFWPEKNRLSAHFYSNEWSFPMNFWAESGRVVGAHILLDAMETR